MTQHLQNSLLYEHIEFTFLVESHLHSLSKNYFDAKPFMILRTEYLFIGYPKFVKL